MPKDNSRTGWFFRDGEVPPNDDAYFENMTRCVFQAGLTWKLIADRWPNFEEAFKGFDIDVVADFD